MALPELTLPPGTPGFQAEGHAIELKPLYADTPMRTGHPRKRRLYTVVPRTVPVLLILTQDQMTAFHDWFEGPLAAGANTFSAQVARQGPGLLWWEARFVEPYTAEPMAGVYWRVTANLLLTGVGSPTAPYTPNMFAAVYVGLSGAASIQASALLSAAATIELLNVENRLSAAVNVDFIAVRDGAPASAVDFEKRWIWMRYPYDRGRTADVTDSSEFDQRSWMGF